MPEIWTIGSEDFQKEILREVKWLASMVMSKDADAKMREAIDRTRFNKKLLEVFTLPLLYTLLAFGRFNSSRYLSLVMKQKRVVERTKQARELLQQPKTKEALCSSLLSLEGVLAKLTHRTTEHTAIEIASTMSRELASPSHTDLLPSDPFVFALSGWLIARTGITKYCRQQLRRTHKL